MGQAPQPCLQHIHGDPAPFRFPWPEVYQCFSLCDMDYRCFFELPPLIHIGHHLGQGVDQGGGGGTNQVVAIFSTACVAVHV